MLDNSAQWLLWLGLCGSVASLLSAVVLVPFAVSWARHRMSSYSFIVVGAEAVGKTSLLRVMSGRLPNKTHVKTLGKSDIQKVVLVLDGGNKSVLSAKIVREIGGEFSKNFSTQFSNMNPDGLIIVVDGNDASQEQQLLYFVTEAINKFYENNNVENINLKAILILINKYDLVGKASQLEVGHLFKNTYSGFFGFLSSKLPNTHVNVCVGSMTEAQFFDGIREGLLFLSRAVKK